MRGTTDDVGNARLFIALWPDAAVRASLAAWSEQWQWNTTAKRVRTERLHLTLHFLGAVPRPSLAQLRQALRLPLAPFPLSLGQPALWPGGIAVLEPDAVSTPLQRLRAALGDTLQGQALAADLRPHRPHVTLARRAAAAVPPARGPHLCWPVRGYALVESVPWPAGGYEVLETYP